MPPARGAPPRRRREWCSLPDRGHVAVGMPAHDLLAGHDQHARACRRRAGRRGAQAEDPRRPPPALHRLLLADRGPRTILAQSVTALATSRPRAPRRALALPTATLGVEHLTRELPLAPRLTSHDGWHFSGLGDGRRSDRVRGHNLGGDTGQESWRWRRRPAFERSETVSWLDPP